MHSLCTFTLILEAWPSEKAQMSNDMTQAQIAFFDLAVNRRRRAVSVGKVMKATDLKVFLFRSCGLAHKEDTSIRPIS